LSERTDERVRAPQQGFAYLTILFVVAIMTAGLAVIGQVWQTAAVREREAELLHIGNEYRKAIERYYLAPTDAKVRQYPKNLTDLIKDPRQGGTVRHLRRLYPDPITGGTEWGLVKAPDGGFAGVYSLSEDAPLKTGNFLVRDATFEGKAKYSEWQFVYAPAATPATATPAKPGAQPATGQPAPAQPAPAQPASGK
jgi:type II secretory pathway pseudopilin PulG